MTIIIRRTMINFFFIRSLKTKTEETEGVRFELTEGLHPQQFSRLSP